MWLVKVKDCELEKKSILFINASYASSVVSTIYQDKQSLTLALGFHLPYQNAKDLM